MLKRAFLLSLVMVFVLALIVNALAPTFGGTKNQVQALKLVAYGCTAGFLGGIFGLIPMLGILHLIDPSPGSAPSPEPDPESVSGS